MSDRSPLHQAPRTSAEATEPTAEQGPVDAAGFGADAAKLHIGVRRIAILLGLAVLTLALLVTLGGGRDALRLMGAADWRLLALAALIHYSGFAVRGHRWQLLLRSAGFRLQYRYLTALLLSGWFVSALLPARAGDLLRIGALRLPPDDPASDRPVVPVADSLGSIVLERALDLFAILALGAFFGFVALRDRLPAWVLNTYLVATALLLLFGLALVVTPALLGLLRRLSTAAVWQKFLTFLVEVVTSLRALGAYPRLALITGVESFYIWLCDAFLLWLVVAALGGWSRFGTAAFVALTVDIVAAVPVTPGGIGQIETAYAGLLTLLGLSTINIAAVILTVRLISYWSFLLVSGAVTFTAGFGAALHSRTKSLPEAQSTSAEVVVR